MSKRHSQKTTAVSSPWQLLNGEMLLGRAAGAACGGGSLNEALVELEGRGYIDVRWDAQGNPKAVRIRGALP